MFGVLYCHDKFVGLFLGVGTEQVFSSFQCYHIGVGGFGK